MNTRQKVYVACTFLGFFLILFLFRERKPYIREITFSISDDIVSFAVNEGNLLGLTKDGEILEYNRKGKERKTGISDVVFLDSQGESFYIKRDGSIIKNLKENYEGETIGKISGAISGCMWYDYGVIVTEKGELYFYYDVNSHQYPDGIPLCFKDIEQVADGWIKINDVMDVTKAVVMRGSGTDTLVILTSSGEVYCYAPKRFMDGLYLSQISDQTRIVDVVTNITSSLFLDEQGNVYEFGDSLLDGSHNHDHLFKKERLSDIVKVALSSEQGAAITKQGETYVWERVWYHHGKAEDEIYHFAKLLIKDIEDIILTNSDYLYVIKDGEATRILLEHFLGDRGN